MNEKQLVKVVGTIVQSSAGGRLETTSASGIKALTRKDDVVQFATRFLVERGVVHFTLNPRGAGTWTTTPIMFLVSEPKLVISYVFTQFPLSEIGHHGKSLTKEELFRDFKFLKRLVK